jgi:hypothetical protein
VNRRADGVAYRMLLIPLRHGEPLPGIAYDPAGGKATITWADQKDGIAFTAGPDHRTSVRVERDGKAVVASE